MQARLTQKAVLTAFCCVCAVLLAFPAFGLAQVTNTATNTEAETTTSDVTPRATDIYNVTQLTGEQNFGDFVVGPGKFDLSITPGASEQVTITVTNRTGQEKLFRLTTEDVAGSNDTETPSLLLGDDRGPYTLKDLIDVPADRFMVGPGERVTIPVTVSLPSDAEPGGRYGSLLVQTASTKSADTANRPSAAIVSRIAVLFFVTTPGELDQSGKFIDFTTVPDKTYFTAAPITFGLLYENTGTVHTNPAGEISITNLFGQEVGYLEVPPWFALPQSLRLREVDWNRETLLGRYTAKARVYRGYDDIIDSKTITFWVIDWRIVSAIAISIVILFLIIRFISKRFTLVRRDS